MSPRFQALLLTAALVATSTAAAATPSESADTDSLVVGAATRDVTPNGVVNLGGFGLGDGSVIPDEVIGRGNTGQSEGERIFARALVVGNGTSAVAFVIVPNIGMFAKYQERFGSVGLVDIAASIESATDGAIGADHVFAAGNHSHSGPDTLGAWGGVDPSYMQLIHDQAVGAVLDAYEARVPAQLSVGAVETRDRNFQGSQGSYDLLDNQVCLETASNSFEGDSNGCAPRQESLDSAVRVLQARAVVPPSEGAQNSARGCEGPGQHAGRTCATVGEVIATFVTYAAHPTLGGAGGLHGDWPEFVAEALEARYGGTGIAWPGAIGRVQPERGWVNRKADYSGNLMVLIDEALASSSPASGTEIDAAKELIRSEVTNAGLAALLHGGEHVGAPLMRSTEAPWLVGNTVQTIVGAARIGEVAFLSVPGEGYPQIALETAASIDGEATLFTLGLADDMLGYLISHTEDYPVLAALSPVNDNAFFNISPRVGDHVMCAGIRAASVIGFDTSPTLVTARCPAFDIEDALVP